LRAIAGITVSKKGRILIDGLDVESIKGKPGIISTNLSEVIIVSRLPVKHVASYYLDLTSGDFDYFEDLVSRLGGVEVLEKRYHELSAGLKKIVLNALAIATRAKHILLDEPFENLDPARRVAVSREILDSTSAKVVNTHATWLIKSLPEWGAYLMAEGLIYGPLKPRELEELKVPTSPVEDAVLRVKLKI
jgi:ABC-2 type transport system ATP-binding protein